MHNVIVGTAGHVDHGKTCLIQALTGINTDRLKEEKKRGITIELGFADMPNDRNLNIGVIDVPGHEKFIKNMLAGIGGIDMVLLVIAADEGIMPQTKEHLEIIKMLQINQGIIVLTKVDLADEEWLEIVKEDIEEYVAGTFLEHAPIMEVSAYTGQNISQLKELICNMAEKSGNRREEPELLRIPVDRVFTIGGFGTVITGTLIEGTITVGDEVEIYPKKKIAKVRNLQVHGNMTEKAFAGQRTAVNLTNIKKEELERGDVIAAKGSLTPTMMLDVRIDMFKDSPRTLVNGSRLHLYYGSAEVLCKVVLLDADVLESGQSGYAQLRLEEEIALKKDDRFILRFYSPLESIGGGIILDSNPPRRKRFHPGTLEALSVKARGNSEMLLEQCLLEESKKMKSLSDIGKQIGFTKEELHHMVIPLLQKGKVIELSKNLVIHKDYFNTVEGKATELLEAYHFNYPITQGIMKEEFRKRLGEKLYLKEGKQIEALVNKLLEEKIVTENKNSIALPHFSVTFTPLQQEMKDRMEREYKSRGYEMPETEEFLAKEKDKVFAKQILEALRLEGKLERLTYNYYIHSDSLDKAIKILRDCINETGSITLSQYRDLLGTSRKYAILILEYLDQQKITKLIDDARVLIG